MTPGLVSALLIDAPVSRHILRSASAAVLERARRYYAEPVA